MISKIKSAKQLMQEDVIELINGDILALRISSFEDHSNCHQWQKSLQTSSKLLRYSNAPDVPVNRIGMTLFETENKSEKLATYLEQGQQTKIQLNKIFGKVNPLDQLTYKLDQTWDAGCNTQKMSKQPMNPGIIRSFEASSVGGLPPHVDSLLKDLPDNNEFDDMKCQLAANMYFEVTQKGGELEIWDYAPSDSQLDELFTGTYDFIDTNKIPVTSHRIKPKQGELILFRSNCIHSVRSSEIGRRSAASCFIGYYGKNKPLTMWA